MGEPGKCPHGHRDLVFEDDGLVEIEDDARITELEAECASLRAERDKLAGELESLRDFKDLLAFVDDADQPVFKSWEQAHRHHKDEPYIGCVFCRDQFVPLARAEQAERVRDQAVEALRFYADRAQWWCTDPNHPAPLNWVDSVEADRGKRAREVLDRAAPKDKGGDGQ